MAKYHKHKAINREIEEAVKTGWRVRPGGHGVVLDCPCPRHLSRRVSVSGTPANPDGELARLRQAVRHCPDRHELDKQPRPRNG
ncbi:hypothetical protein HDA45_002701 [Amycolatopsis umgeniensis]|uniref:Uncharacterized protein n=1 Tax=Amycolatopsis umgeniensis TaxID=336628 RepID=A0A841B299_9PSEU|nr:hypothetical protein [Amycolatopsis umgeniensis]